jgi:Mlc titration factor MtfA (ptsG expression regulator)
MAGQDDPADGRNLVLHEFAHRRDLESGATDRVPPTDDSAATGNRGAILEKEYANVVRDACRGRRTVLGECGTTNRAEFLAVATEAYFEIPARLRERMPDLYAELERVYAVAPAGWVANRR